MFKKLFPYIIAAFIGSITTIAVNSLSGPGETKLQTSLNHLNKQEQTELPKKQPTSVRYVNTSIDFASAAEKAITEVVHIKASIQVKNKYHQNIPDIFRDFFGDDFLSPRDETRQGSGSGVIISQDGYIVTNYHVIQNATDISVTMHNNKSYSARLVGTDPSTDLALLKIAEQDLSYMEFASSHDVNIGDWVLAVGNPFNLSSTVTAGIVSAKARSINIMRDRYAIESFIQTDAAVNPGNSGGALVNLGGKLIGINSAIASPTGSFAGYSFAIPSDIVSKVVGDLKEFGIVQRAYLGVSIREMNARLAEELDTDVLEGVLIDAVSEDSGAEEAGLKPKDIIIRINKDEIKSMPQLLETVGQHRPGDVIKVLVNRDGDELTFDVTLKNKDGNVAVITKDYKKLEAALGAIFVEVTDQNQLMQLSITGGVEIKSLLRGKLKSQTSVEEGFIITKANNQPISTIDDLQEIVESTKGGIMLEGIYPDKEGVYYFAFGNMEEE